MNPGAAASTIQGKGMKLQIVGSPGTWSGLALRVSKCVFAAASVWAMVTVFGFSAVNYFSYMNIVMLLQTMWSLGFACLDIYAMRNTNVLHNHALVMFLVYGDLITATLTLAAASCAAGVATLIVELDFCRKILREEACSQTALPIVLAFIAFLFAIAASIPMAALQVARYG